MPYGVKLSLYLLTAAAVALVISVLLAPYGRVVNIALAIVAAYLTVVIGRRVLGRKSL